MRWLLLPSCIVATGCAYPMHSASILERPDPGAFLRSDPRNTLTAADVGAWVDCQPSLSVKILVQNRSARPFSYGRASLQVVDGEGRAVELEPPRHLQRHATNVDLRVDREKYDPISPEATLKPRDLLELAWSARIERPLPPLKKDVQQYRLRFEVLQDAAGNPQRWEATCEGEWF
jgi:hypothetical protein